LRRTQTKLDTVTCGGGFLSVSPVSERDFYAAGGGIIDRFQNLYSLQRHIKYHCSAIFSTFFFFFFQKTFAGLEKNVL